jgi:glycine/D-amino acid oxidase-like deaminating enzyme
MLMLPKDERSYWRGSYVDSEYGNLNIDLEVDVAVIGAGITGLTSAYLLKQSGLTVAVLEKSTIGGGTTGRTTGKVTSQHNLIYSELNSHLGKSYARLYGEANQAALEQVNSIVVKEQINCNWHREDNYVYTTKAGQVETLKKEAKIATELGLPASFEATSPLPFAITGAVKFENQAKIDSQLYLLGLARAVQGNGCFV